MWFLLFEIANLFEVVAWSQLGTLTNGTCSHVIDIDTLFVGSVNAHVSLVFMRIVDNTL